MTSSTTAAVPAAATPTEYVEDERIGDLLEHHKDRGPWFSFEFYPPKTADGVEKLYDRLGKMAPYSTCPWPPLSCPKIVGLNSDPFDDPLIISTRTRTQTQTRSSWTSRGARAAPRRT